MKSRSGRSSLIVMLLILAAFTLVNAACTAIATAPQKQIHVAYGSHIDPADIADQLGLRILEEEMGYEVKVTELTEDSNAVSAMISGEVQVSSIGLPDSIKAYQLGVPLQVIIPSNMVGEFVLIGQPGIDSVEDLIGKKVAYHGPGSGTEILPRLLVRQAGIDENEVEWVILPESPNRAAAMEAERIDVTALEFADVLTLQEGGKNYEIIASFSDVAPEAIYSTWVTTTEFAEENPDVIRDLAMAIAKGYAQAALDKNSWIEMAQERLPASVPAERLSQTYDFYMDIGMFPQPPYYDQATWEAMSTFYTSVGEIGDPASYNMVLIDAVAAAKEAFDE